jgi:formylglycine-generating enzyme required for sulfatase activity/transcriptional regulator with XRE-family HTH domain
MMAAPLGDLLRTRRLSENLTQQELARQMGVYEGSVTAVERGEEAPTPQYLHRFTEVLHLSGQEVAELWRVYQEEPSLPDAATAHVARMTDCPYRGLLAFREPDAPYFFGREALADRVLSKMRDDPIVGVVGASGTGKSSLVFAGVIPKLRIADEWLVAPCRPATRPFESLAAALIAVTEEDLHDPLLSEATARLAATLMAPGGLYACVEGILRKQNRNLLIVVDQFEELFTQVADGAVRERYLDALVDACSASVGPQATVRCLLTVRGDFYGRLIAYRRFSDALQDRIVHLPPMSRTELRDAIVKPAAVSGIKLEGGLVERILGDVGGEPGNLPLLEFSLTLLWEKQVDGSLTRAAYEAFGELGGAIASQAEAVYTSLAAEQQYTARRLFTRLVALARPEEDGNDARRRAQLTEFAALPRVERVIAALTSARLLVTDSDSSGQETVEVAHEAVIRNWNRLRGWLVEDREFLLWLQRLRQWHGEWEFNDRENGALLRGRLLAEAEGWLGTKDSDIAPHLREYIERSIAAHEAYRRQQALDRADFLLSARPEEVPTIIESLADSRHWVDPRLVELLSTARPTDRWRLRLALLAIDATQAPALLEELPTMEATEVLICRDMLVAYRDRLTPQLWDLLGNKEAAPDDRFRAAVLLASFSTDDRRWHSVACDVAGLLIAQNRVYLRDWTRALRPVRGVLFAPLQQLAKAPHRETVREAAAALLLNLADDRFDVLAAVSSDSLADQYERLVSAISSSPRSAEQGRVALQAIVAQAAPASAAEAERVDVGHRRAVAGCTLLRLGDWNGLSELLSFDADPEAVTQFILEARQRGLSANLLADQLLRVPSGDGRFGLLLALGYFDAGSVSAERMPELVRRVDAWHHADPDSGVHSASEWLRERWNIPRPIGSGPPLHPYEAMRSREWFTVVVGDQVLTFAVFRPSAFLMGAPDGEEERRSYETRPALAPPQREVRLTSPFAVCTREVTRREFELFMRMTQTTGLPNVDEFSPSADDPVVGVTWSEAVEYGQWFSEQASAPPAAERRRGSGDASEPASPRDTLVFRLPTEAEWECACRAGTITAFSFGSERQRLDGYGWYASNSALKPHAPGSLLPNRRGLFDMHGNCWEWCLDWLGSTDLAPMTDPTGAPTGDRKVLRGGCWNLGAAYSRSACRTAHLPTNRNYYIGFRLVCTLPTAKPSEAP